MNGLVAGHAFRESEVAVNLILVLTDDCTRRCRYCYAGARRPSPMPAAIGERAIDLALSRSPDSLRVGFFGGEPLLQLPLMRHLTDYARAQAGGATRVSFQVTTSGDTLDQREAAFLGTNGYQVSLSVHGQDWPATRRRLAMLEASGLQPRAVVVADAAGAPLLSEKIEALAAAGARDIAISPNYYDHWRPEARVALQTSYLKMARHYRTDGSLGGARLRLFDSRLDALRTGVPMRRARCGLGRGQIAVGPDGTLFPCDRMAVDRTGAAMQVGHLESGLDEVRLAHLERERRRVPRACAVRPNHAICAQFCACVSVHLEGRVCAVPEVVCWHESMLADVVRALFTDTERGSAGQRHARRRMAVAASLAVAAVIAGSCGGEKAASRPGSSAASARPAQVTRAQATWVTYPETGTLRIVDKSGEAGGIRLTLLTALPAERLRALLVADEAGVATLIQERLRRIDLVSLSDKAEERAVGRDLLRALRQRIGAEANLRGIRLAAGPWELSEREIEVLKTMGYIE